MNNMSGSYSMHLRDEKFIKPEGKIPVDILTFK
jgi:hypothetical protein